MSLCFVELACLSTVPLLSLSELFFCLTWTSCFPYEMPLSKFHSSPTPPPPIDCALWVKLEKHPSRLMETKRWHCKLSARASLTLSSNLRGSREAFPPQNNLLFSILLLGTMGGLKALIFWVISLVLSIQ